MVKTLSCGVLLLNERDELLLCHVTGASWWDIPKGGQDEGESYQETALRELLEETGIVVAPAALLDLGHFSYRPEKALYLFAARLDSSRLDLSQCACTTYFEQVHTKVLQPEVDDFRWVGFAEVATYCAKSMARLLTTELSLMQVRLRVPNPAPLTSM